MQGLPQEEGHGRERWPLGVATAIGLDCPSSQIDLRGNQVRPWLRVLDLPETEAPHPGISSGGVEVEGVFVRASLTGNGSPKPGGDEMMKAWAKLRPGLGKLKGN